MSSLVDQPEKWQWHDNANFPKRINKKN